MDLRAVIENSIKASRDPFFMRQRSEQVRALEPAARRMAIQAIDTAVSSVVRIGRFFNDRDIRKAGLVRLGSGVEHEVFRFGDDVIKYAHDSYKLDAAARLARVREKQLDFLKLASGIGDFMPVQRISVEPHRFMPGRDVIQTLQPYIPFTSAIELRGVGNIPELTSAASLAADSISNFIDGSWRAYAKHRVLPDLNGMDNLVIHSNGKLVLIDTQPIGPENPAIQAKVEDQLRAIHDQLDKIAS